MTPLLLSAYTITNALGAGLAASWNALEERRSGLRPCDLEHAPDLETWIGRVEGLEDEPLTGELAPFDCRNNRLARRGLEQDGFVQAVAAARRRYGGERVAVFLGSSTSGIARTEWAYRHRDPDGGALPAAFDYRHTHNSFSVTDLTRRYLGLSGPAMTISTACSSSAKVFATAWRFIHCGLCDAAVVGGVDSLCLTTLYGFRSLELLSRQPCRPWDRRRDGINIGEGAGFALLERCDGRPGVALLGYGESSDAYHMSTPHPEGAGAARAMAEALARAGLEAADLDYVNLHGTATPSNDAAEDRAVTGLLGQVPCSSTKGWTGHTLGAAGITEAVFAALAIEHGLMPGCLHTRERDPALKAGLLLDNHRGPVARVLSNSFGFGGSNCALLLGRVAC